MLSQCRQCLLVLDPGYHKSSLRLREILKPDFTFTPIEAYPVTPTVPGEEIPKDDAESQVKVTTLIMRFECQSKIIIF